MSDKPSQSTVEVNGNKYLLQKLPNMSYLELRDNSKGPTGALMDSKFYKEVLDKIVVGVNDEFKKVSPNDFDNFEEMDKVVSEAVKFQHGGKYK